MSDLAKSFQAKLATVAQVQSCPVASCHRSQDGSTKWLFDVGGGNAVECVFIPERGRGTLCLSSQAGCAMGCAFCATGAQGFARNLTTAEMVSQLWFAEHTLRRRAAQESRAITNVVMMGMGEPLQNYDALLPALRIMLDAHGYGLSRRRVTVSTCGLVPMMERLARDCPVALAVSLHAPSDALRDALVPINRKYPLAQLLAACTQYLARAPRDFITFEYCLIGGVNDGPEHAKELVRLLHPYNNEGLRAKFNLIAFNPFAQSSFRRPAQERVSQFSDILSAAGWVTTLRKSRGGDIAAACGQLAGEVQDRTRVSSRRANSPLRPLSKPLSAPISPHITAPISRHISARISPSHSPRPNTHWAQVAPTKEEPHQKQGGKGF